MRSSLKIILVTTVSIILAPLIMAQNVIVTGTITDTQSTPYSNGSLTVSLVNTTGQQATFGGSPSFQKVYSATLNSSGAFSISLPPNSTASPSISPTGTQWNFSYQSQGGYGAANVSVTITGAGDISGSLSGLTRIMWPYGNIPPPGGSGQGIVFVSSTTLGWGSTGSGSVSNQVTNGIPVNTNGTATALNAVVCTPPASIGFFPAGYSLTTNAAAPPGCPQFHIDDGITTASTLTATEKFVDTTSIATGSGASAAGPSAAGGLACTESTSTGWTPTVGQDYQRCDSVTHLWVCSVNGGAEYPCGASFSALTTGFLPKATGTASAPLANSLCDEVTTANTFTCAQLLGMAVPNGAIQTGSTPPAVTVGTAGGKAMNEGTTPSGMPAASDAFYASSAFQALTAFNHNVNEGPYLTASRNLIWNANQAAQSQVVVSGTEYYITKSDLDMPAIYRLAIGAGTAFHWRIALTKTAAGTGTFQILLKKGTNGSTADSTSATITVGTQTAAADNMEADITITFTSATAYYWSVIPRQSAATGTGFGLVYPAAAAQFTGTVSGLTTTTASDKYGLSVVFTTGTPTFVVNEVFATANGVL